MSIKKRAFDNTLKQAIADAVASQDKQKVLAAIDAALAVVTGQDNREYLQRLRAFVIDGQPRFSILALDGNGKLPFVAFSSLPGQGFCPGMGACEKFCYSFRAWRYPAAFSRQVQNSILMQSQDGREKITAAIDAAIENASQDNPGIESLDFRLYVDGDFGSVSEVEYWMGVIRKRPILATYGYSKSWRELLTYDSQENGNWPANYLVNLSGGSRHSDAIQRAMAALPIARGEFLAVDMGRKVTSDMHGQPAHQKALRDHYRRLTGRKAFTCPGKCGDCTNRGHACGSDRFRNIPIIIATH